MEEQLLSSKEAAAILGFSSLRYTRDYLGAPDKIERSEVGIRIFTANRMFARKRKNSNATDVSRRNGRVRSVVIIAEKHVKNVN